MRDELYEEMFRMEQRHWWFLSKHRIVQHLLSRYLPHDAPDAARQRVVDLGCGCGMMLHHLREQYDVAGMDASPQAIAFCAQRGIRVEQGFLPDQVPFDNGSFDAVLLLDVLEHLEQDIASAARATDLLKPGGVMICTVPAYQWLWTKRDEYHYHYRRYSAGAFKRLFDRPDLRLELFSHFNTLLFPLAAAGRLWSRWRHDDGMKDLRVPPAPINWGLDRVFASERLLLGRVPLPFGLSLAAVARKTGPAWQVTVGHAHG